MRACSNCRFGRNVEILNGGVAVQCRREAPTFVSVGMLVDAPVMPADWWCGRWGRNWTATGWRVRHAIARRLRAFAADLNA